MPDAARRDELWRSIVMSLAGGRVAVLDERAQQRLLEIAENIGSRKLNLCTMIVSIADVFDALRSNRPYRQGLATSRIRAIMGEQDNPAFSQPLLKRFVNMMGLFPVGKLVRLTRTSLPSRSTRRIRSGLK